MRTLAVFGFTGAVCLACLLTGCIERRVYVQAPQAVPAAPPPGQIVIETPPKPQVEVVVPSPGPQYVWTSGHWSWQGRWVWVRGAWVLPPRPHAIWVPGHWVRRGHGHVWISGYWH